MPTSRPYSMPVLSPVADLFQESDPVEKLPPALLPPAQPTASTTLAHRIAAIRPAQPTASTATRPASTASTTTTASSTGAMAVTTAFSTVYWDAVKNAVDVSLHPDAVSPKPCPSATVASSLTSSYHTLVGQLIIMTPIHPLHVSLPYFSSTSTIDRASTTARTAATSNGGVRGGGPTIIDSSPRFGE